MAIELTPASDATEESTERWKSTTGSAHVTTGGSPKQIVVPSIKLNGGGITTTGTIVPIDSGAAAGSQHLQAAGDIEVDVLQELIGFEFDATSTVRKVLLGVLNEANSVSEVGRFAFTVNGDLVSDASNLYIEANNVISVPAGMLVEIPSPTVNITRVGVIAKASGVSKAAGLVTEFFCVGVKDA